jgi:hypothetical protein
MIILYTYKDGCNAVENKGTTIYHVLGATLLKMMHKQCVCLLIMILLMTKPIKTY